MTETLDDVTIKLIIRYKWIKENLCVKICINNRFRKIQTTRFVITFIKYYILLYIK